MYWMNKNRNGDSKRYRCKYRIFIVKLPELELRASSAIYAESWNEMSCRTRLPLVARPIRRIPVICSNRHPTTHRRQQLPYDSNNIRLLLKFAFSFSSSSMWLFHATGIAPLAC
jgi:hypothetical protein